jgi:hypothetical protein
MTQLETAPPDSIEHDLPCAGCGYNLRSAPRDGICPECGLAVERSVGSDNALWEARPAWLRSLSLGIWLMLASQLVFFTVTLLGEPVLDFFGLDNPNGVVSGSFALAAVYAAGVWMLTRRERTFQFTADPTAPLRRVARVGTLGLPASLMIMWGVIHNYVPDSYTTSTVVAGCVVVFIVGMLATYLYLRTLAKRVLSQRMSEYAAIVAVGGAITLAISLVFVLYTFFEASDLSNDATLLTTGLIGTALILFYLWSLLVLVMFAVTLMRASRKTRALWTLQTA